MNYEVDYDDKKESSKRPPKKSECGEIEIKAENVYITINCKDDNKE
jgi:hypothetical protein